MAGGRSTSAVLPFEAFLTLLRAKGFAVGLHEHLALAHLLDRWEGTSSPEFGDALAALVARNDDEVVAIRRLFVEVYGAPAPGPTASETTPPPDPWAVLRRHAWSLAAAAALVLLAAAVWFSFRAPATAPLPPSLAVPAPQPAPAPPITRPVDAPPPPAPEPPPPPERIEPRVAWSIGSVVFLVALAGFWAAKARETQRRWLRNVWAGALAALPGPYHFPFALRDPVARLPRIDVEDAATILGRAITNELQARDLDVRRSVRLTVRKGLLPSFVYKPRRMLQTILVVQDISEDMVVWRGKVDLFLTDLRRQGIGLERYYFDADLRRLTENPRGGTLDFDRVLRRRPNAPVLIVSNGAGLGAALAASQGEGGDLWLRTLRVRERRSWLTPVSDPRLWPAELEQMPIRVWPMTRRGLAQAARDLAGVDAGPPEQVRARILDEGRVSLDGIERMKRLASLVPYPTTELLELLRRRFAPDVPDAVVLHLLQEAGRPASPVLRLSDEEIGRCLAAVRLETPKLEAQVRRTLLRILGESEPPADSAAHVRWEIAVALHRLALADLGEGDRAQAVAAIEALGRGPMWEEVRTLARLTPGTPALGRHVRGALGSSGPLGDRVPPLDDPPHEPPLHAARSPWTWPGIRELAPAAFAASLALLIGWQLQMFPLRALEHVTDAYDLEYAAAPAATQGVTPAGGELLLRLGTNETSALPRIVSLYQDDAVYRPDIDLSSGSASVRLGNGDIGRHYQVRATLPEGNLALSRSVWVPDERTIVLIDALPWARVTFVGDQVPPGAQTTPFSAALRPGAYRLQFENGGLTAPMEQQITVPATGAAGPGAGQQTFRFTMPGFDPARTATQLSGGPPAPQNQQAK